MSSVTLDDAKEAKDEVREGNLRENDAGITEDLQVDYDEHSPDDVKGHAEALVTFDHIARISINTFGDDVDLLTLEQNLEGAGQYGYTLELTLANPEVVDGEIWKETDTEYPEYKVIGDPESDNNNYEVREDIIRDDDGNVTGAETIGIGNLGTNSWDGKPVDGFESDYITVSISARRASRILGALDTAGMWYRDQDGNVREGLFETPPHFGTEEYDSDEHGAPRLVGYPELRSDMVGQRGAISWTFGDEGSSGNRAVEVDVYKVTDDGLEALTSLTPEDDAYALPTYPRGGSLYWDDSDSTGGGANADAEPQTDDSVEDAREMMSDDSVSYEDLTDDAQDFVLDAVDAIEALDEDSVDAFEDPDFEGRVETYSASNDVEASADDLATIVDERV